MYSYEHGQVPGRVLPVMRVIYALFGAAFPIAFAWALGIVLLRKLSLSLHRLEERLLAIVLGSTCLSHIPLRGIQPAPLSSRGAFHHPLEYRSVLPSSEIGKRLRTRRLARCDSGLLSPAARGHDLPELEYLRRALFPVLFRGAGLVPGHSHARPVSELAPDNTIRSALCLCAGFKRN